MPSIPDDDDNSIFTRSQYIKIKSIAQEKEENTPKDWRKILDDPAEISKFCMWLLSRAHQIYSKSKPIKMQTLEESKQYYKLLTLGDFDKFLREKYESTDESQGVTYEYMLTDYRKFLNNSVSKKSFSRLLDNKGVSKRRDRFYRTDQNNVFSTELQTATQEHVQINVVLGIIPKKSKSANSIQEKL